MGKDIKLSFSELKQLLDLKKKKKTKKPKRKPNNKLKTRGGMMGFNKIGSSSHMPNTVSSRPVNMNLGSSIETRQIETFRSDINQLKNQLVKAETDGNKDDENLFKQALIKLEPALLMAEQLNNPKTDGSGDFSRKSFLESTLTKENLNRHRQENSLSNRLESQHNYTPIRFPADLSDAVVDDGFDNDGFDNDISMITEQEQEMPTTKKEYNTMTKAQLKAIATRRNIPLNKIHKPDDGIEIVLKKRNKNELIEKLLEGKNQTN
jgi:hypothetical protein